MYVAIFMVNEKGKRMMKRVGMKEGFVVR